MLEVEIVWCKILQLGILEKIRCIAEDFIENQTDEKKVETVKNGSDTSVTIRLPRYELPKFHGDVLEFTAFWEQFEDSMHSHQDISDSAKFSHLCSSLGGSVLAALNDLSLTVVNCFAATKILKDCFGRRRRLMMKKWEEEVFVDYAKNSDIAWTQLLGHPRSAKAIKTHANAEKVTTAAALQAKVESQSDSSAFCVVHISSFTVGNFHKRRPKSDGVYVKNEAFVFIAFIKQWVDIRHEGEIKQYPDAPAMGRYMLGRSKKAASGRPSNGWIYVMKKK
ncbi:hypothetical protein T01_14517 [Trichinella spiralis]|uniref:Uncharacterized protein n=1 Tax=Trichinella spiralis TaxID=6334 RepID=A0A0V1BM72_TRISP|nr:hypothetical protein T01_14517 [Trichinella spiralis]